MNGKKYDNGKPRMDLLPAEALAEVAKVFGFGAEKYGDYQWRGGINHNRLYAAAMRHMITYWNGETEDPESGLNHLGHVLANIMMMISTPQHDNRYNGKETETNENSIIRSGDERVVGRDDGDSLCRSSNYRFCGTFGV